jgi:hypothetical protein
MQNQPLSARFTGLGWGSPAFATPGGNENMNIEKCNQLWKNHISPAE